MTPRSTELRNGVCKSREGSDVEDRVCIFTILDASFGEDEGYEVDARLVQAWNGGGVCEELWIIWLVERIAVMKLDETYPCINVADVANDVAMAIKHRKRCYSFVVHEPQRIG